VDEIVVELGKLEEKIQPESTLHRIANLIKNSKPVAASVVAVLLIKMLLGIGVQAQAAQNIEKQLTPQQEKVLVVTRDQQGPKAFEEKIKQYMKAQEQSGYITKTQFTNKRLFASYTDLTNSISDIREDINGILLLFVRHKKNELVVITPQDLKERRFISVKSEGYLAGVLIFMKKSAKFNRISFNDLKLMREHSPKVLPLEGDWHADVLSNASAFPAEYFDLISKESTAWVPNPGSPFYYHIVTSYAKNRYNKLIIEKHGKKYGMLIEQNPSKEMPLKDLDKELVFLYAGNQFTNFMKSSNLIKKRLKTVVKGIRNVQKRFNSSLPAAVTILDVKKEGGAFDSATWDITITWPWLLQGGEEAALLVAEHEMLHLVTYDTGTGLTNVRMRNIYSNVKKKLPSFFTLLEESSISKVTEHAEFIDLLLHSMMREEKLKEALDIPASHMWNVQFKNHVESFIKNGFLPETKYSFTKEQMEMGFIPTGKMVQAERLWGSSDSLQSYLTKLLYLDLFLRITRIMQEEVKPKYRPAFEDMLNMLSKNHEALEKEFLKKYSTEQQLYDELVKSFLSRLQTDKW